MDSLPVNALDLGVLVAFVLAALMGLALGFVKLGLFVLSWLGAILATFYGFPIAKPYARDFIETPWIADVTAGATLLLATLTILFVISSVIGSWVRNSRLNALDRSLGMVAGLGTAALLVSLAYVFVEMAQPVSEQPPWLRSARSIPVIEAGARLLRSLIPDDDDPAAAATDARKKAQRMLDNEKAMRQMLSARPKGRDSGAPGGYGPHERRDMERLIDSSQKPK